MTLGFNPDGLGTQTEIVQINGQFFERKTNILSGTVEDTPININLSPTRDPREALNIQKNNEFISQAKKAALYAPIGGGTIAVGRYAIPKIPSMLRGVRDFFVKRKDLQVPPKRVLEEGVVKTIPGAILPGAGGFGLTTPGAVVAGGAGTTGAIVGLDQLVAGETPDIRAIKDIDMTVLEDDAGNITDVVETQLEVDAYIEPDPKPEPEPEVVVEPEADPKPKLKAQPDINPLFDNPNFGMFLRNIGKSLVETGQMGTGLAVGAARAAEERALVEKQREVAFQELLKEQVKAGANVETITPNKATEIQTNYVTTAGDYFRTQTTEDLLNTVVGIMQRDDVTGGLSYLQEIGFRLKSAFNMAGEEPSVILVENVLTEIANSQPGDLLGQSSGRLSDRDIQLAQDLLGALRGPKKVFKSNEEVLNILNRRKTAIGSEQAERLNLLKLYGDQLTSAGYGIPPIQDFSKPAPQSSSDIAGEANLGD